MAEVRPGPAIGKRIEAIMSARGFTQGQIAVRAGMSQPTVHKIIAGKIEDPALSVVLRIARALGVGVDVLLSDVVLPESLEEQVADLQEKLAALNERVSP